MAGTDPAVHTHGHADHACGLPPFLEEAIQKGHPAPLIIGHRKIAARFDRYRMTASWNGLICEARAQASDALVTRGIFSRTARDSATKAGRNSEQASGPAPTRGG